MLAPCTYVRVGVPILLIQMGLSHSSHHFPSPLSQLPKLFMNCGWRVSIEHMLDIDHVVELVADLQDCVTYAIWIGKMNHIKKSMRLVDEENYLSLAIIYPLLNRQEEANAAAKKILEMNPNFSVEMASKGWPYKNQADLDLVIDALHKAGLN